jgi:hypothetical protein
MSFSFSLRVWAIGFSNLLDNTTGGYSITSIKLYLGFRQLPGCVTVMGRKLQNSTSEIR